MSFFPEKSIVKDERDRKLMFIMQDRPSTPEEVAAFIEAHPTPEELVARLIKVERFISEMKGH